MFTAHRAFLLCVAVLGCASVSAQGLQQPEKKLAPDQSAANFIAQFYHVTPDQITAKVLSRGKNAATVLTSATGQPDCVLEMVPAPDSNASYSWLIGGFTCDKVLDQALITEWMKKGQPGAEPK